MSAKEMAVREAARKLATAIAEATEAGYRIEWPASLAGLPGIAISETAAVKPEEAVDLSKLSRADLVARAEAAGIDVKSDWNKSDLITALNG